MTPLFAQIQRRGEATQPPARVRSAWRRLSATLSLLPLLACANGDTILALNVSSADDVGLISALRVTVTQEGREPLEVSLEPPLKDVDGGQVISSNFFERIKLPASWDEGSVEVDVEAISPSAAALSASATAQIKPGAAVAAYVELARMPAGADDDDAGEDADASDGSAGTGDAGSADATADSDAQM